MTAPESWTNHFDEKSPFLPCGDDLTELFKSTAWQFLVNFRIADAPAILASNCSGRSLLNSCPRNGTITFFFHVSPSQDPLFFQ
jgi:hypothetical protein